jgi:hypothetical protein
MALRELLSSSQREALETIPLDRAGLIEHYLLSDQGGTSRKGHLCTLRSAGGVSGASERSEATLGYPFVGVPGVVAG